MSFETHHMLCVVVRMLVEHAPPGCDARNVARLQMGAHAGVPLPAQRVGV